jgi:hypothetical protein
MKLMRVDPLLNILTPRFTALSVAIENEELLPGEITILINTSHVDTASVNTRFTTRLPPAWPGLSPKSLAMATAPWSKNSLGKVGVNQRQSLFYLICTQVNIWQLHVYTIKYHLS